MPVEDIWVDDDWMRRRPCTFVERHSRGIGKKKQIDLIRVIAFASIDLSCLVLIYSYIPFLRDAEELFLDFNIQQFKLSLSMKLRKKEKNRIIRAHLQVRKVCDLRTLALKSCLLGIMEVDLRKCAEE